MAELHGKLLPIAVQDIDDGQIAYKAESLAYMMEKMHNTIYMGTHTVKAVTRPTGAP